MLIHVNGDISFTLSSAIIVGNFKFLGRDYFLNRNLTSNIYL